MNKSQKIAVQMAKDDMKKGYEFTFNFNRNGYYAIIKRHRFPIQKALGFKNWNKTCDY